jgi:TrfA protein
MATQPKPQPGESEKMTRLNEKSADSRRKIYLRSKNINPSEPYQLDFLFSEDLANKKRHLPNDFARSTLFTAVSKTTPRRSFLREKLFHYNDHIEILYTGTELRAEDDELVWLQIINYGQNVELGLPFEFSISQMLEDLDWTPSGANYRRIRECLSRLKANEIYVSNSQSFGVSGSLSLIENYTAANDESANPTKYKVWIDKRMVLLFAGNTFSSHNWDKYRALSPIARRLADYIASHRSPYPLSLARFREMCGSTDSSVYSFKQSTKKACALLQDVGIVTAADVDSKNFINCTRPL